jgi:hypothetical protein
MRDRFGVESRTPGDYMFLDRTVGSLNDPLNGQSCFSRRGRPDNQRALYTPIGRFVPVG